MIPQETIDVLRGFSDVSINNFGIDVNLYIPNNLNTVEENDIYGDHSQYTYDHYTTLVWVVWSPDVRTLRKFGFFSEENLPIIARFRNLATNEDGEEVEVDVTLGSYVKVNIQNIPNKYQDNDEFEVVDVLVGNVHDALLARIYQLAPRRVKG